MSDINNINSLRESLFSDLFGEALKNKGRVNLFIARPKTKGGEDYAALADKVGANQAKGAWAADAEITSLDFSAIFGTKKGIKHIGNNTLGQSTVNAFMQGDNALSRQFTYDTARRQNVIAAWDAWSLKQLSQRNLNGPIGTYNRSGFIDVKKISRLIFDDLPEFTNTLGNLSEFTSQVQENISKGQFDSSSSLSYLSKSYSLLNKEYKDIKPSEHVEAVLNAAYLKAKDTGRLGDLRQLMYMSGVRNMSDIVETIHSPTDQYGAHNLFKSAMKPNSRGYFYSGGPGSNKEAFLGQVEKFFGEQYAREELPIFMDTLSKGSTAKNVSYLLSDQGSLFIGQGQVWSTFQPVQAEVAGIKAIRDAENKITGYAGDVSEYGLKRGTMTIADRLAMVKQAVVDGKVVPASRPILGQYAEGILEKYAGLKEGNVGVALETGFRMARKVSDNYATAIVSRGVPSTAASLVTSYSAYRPDAYEEFAKAITRVSGATGGLRSVDEEWNAAKNVVKDYQKAVGESDAYAAIKPKDASIALEGIEDWFLPGSMTDKEMMKGIYHRFKPEEITSESQIGNIQSAINRLYGKAIIDGKVHSKITGRFASIAGPNATGLLSGEYRTIESSIKAMQGLEGELTGRSGNRLVTKFTLPTLFLSSKQEAIAGETADDLQRREFASFLKKRQMFGEPGIELLKEGRGMFKNMLRPTTTLDMTLNKEELSTVLDMMSMTGAKSDHKELQTIFDKLTGSGDHAPGRYFSPEGIKLDKKAIAELRKAGIKLPQGADRLTYASYQSWDYNVKFGFGSKITPGSISTVFGSQRATLFNPTNSRFDKYSNFAAAVTSGETLASMNPIDIMYSHRTGLTNLAKGGPKAFVKEYKKVASEMGHNPDLIDYKKLGKERFIVANAAKNKDLNFAKEFEPVSRKVLQNMGITDEQIEGNAIAMAKLLKQSAKGLKNSDKYYYINNMLRIGETEDIMNQSKAMRPRLELIRRWAKGIEGYYGIKPSQHPLFMEYASSWERSTGLKLNPELLETGFASGGKLVVKPTEMTNQWLHLQAIQKQLGSSAEVEEFASTHGLKILEKDEVIQKFLRGTHKLSLSMETGQEGINAGLVNQSALFSAENRPEELRRGFFMKFEDPMLAPLGSVAQAEQEAAVKTKYLWVPGTEKGFRKFFGTRKIDPSFNLRMPKDSLEYNILGTISALENPAGENGVTKGTLERYFADSYRAYAGYTKPGGVLKQKAFAGKRMTGGATMRAVPRADLSSYDALKMAESGVPTEDMFTIGISKKELEASFKGKGKGKVLKAAQKNMEERKFLWGGVMPNPFHTAAHGNIVKYKLMDTLTDVGKGNEPRAMMDAFLTWKMNRDNDKDVVQTLIKAGVDPKSDKAWEEAFAAQVKSAAPEYNQFLTEMKKAYKDEMEATGKSLSVGKFLNRHKTQMDEFRFMYLSFGKTPALSYAQEWSPFSIASELSREASPEEIAKSLNKMIPQKMFKEGKGFTPEFVSKMQSTLGSTPTARRQISSVASLLEGNALQAFITKGGAFSEDMKEMLNLGSKIMEVANKGGDQDEAVKLAQVESLKLFRAIGGYKVNDAGIGEYTEASKLRTQGKYFAERISQGATTDDVVREAADIYGRTLGVGIFSIASTVEAKSISSGMFDPLRMATKQRTGRLDKISAVFGNAFDRLVEWSHIASSQSGASQKGAAAANEELKAKAAQGGSDVLSKGASWLSNNWKGVAVAIGAVAGLRALYAATSSDEVERPPMKSSRSLSYGNVPLPPEPMVTPQADYSSQTFRQPRAFVMRPNQYSRTDVNGNFNSVNTNDLRTSINMSPFARSNGQINIVDSRSYTSNWQMQSIAKDAEDSDFIHPYTNYG